MVGVKFDDFHSWDDWKLRLKSFDLGMPEEKRDFVSA